MMDSTLLCAWGRYLSSTAPGTESSEDELFPPPDDSSGVPRASLLRLVGVFLASAPSGAYTLAFLLGGVLARVVPSAAMRGLFVRSGRIAAGSVAGYSAASDGGQSEKNQQTSRR